MRSQTKVKLREFQGQATSERKPSASQHLFHKHSLDWRLILELIDFEIPDPLNEEDYESLSEETKESSSDWFK